MEGSGREAKFSSKAVNPKAGGEEATSTPIVPPKLPSTATAEHATTASGTNAANQTD